MKQCNNNHLWRYYQCYCMLTVLSLNVSIISVTRIYRNLSFFSINTFSVNSRFTLSLYLMLLITRTVHVTEMFAEAFKRLVTSNATFKLLVSWFLFCHQTKSQVYSITWIMKKVEFTSKFCFLFVMSPPLFTICAYFIALNYAVMFVYLLVLGRFVSIWWNTTVS